MINTETRSTKMTPEQRRTLSNVLRERMRRLSADLDVLRAMLETAARSGDCPADIVENLNSEVAEWLRFSEQFEADIARLESGEIDAEQVEKLRRMACLN
jgi:hypothetical protein